jgi:hypothetical protein
MSNCSVCGEPTQLHVNDKPICFKCDAASPQERRMRRERSQALSTKAVASNGSASVVTART